MAERTVTIRYFAWVREKIGVSEERVALPAHIATVGDLVAWMQTRGDGYARAFVEPAAIRTAVNHKHVKADALIGDAREIGFFPPVTGG